jgi:hypothetical protein
LSVAASSFASSSASDRVAEPCSEECGISSILAHMSMYSIEFVATAWVATNLPSNVAGLLPGASSGSRMVESSLECGPKPRTRQDVSMRARESVLYELPCALRGLDAGVELHDLALGQVIPVPIPPLPGGEEPTDLGKREAGLLAEANQRDPLLARRRKVPPPAGTLGG